MNCKDCDYHDCKEKRRTYFHVCSPTFSSWFIEEWILELKKVLQVIWRQPNIMERGKNLIFMFEFQHCLLGGVCERTRIGHRGSLFRSSPFLSTEARWSFRQLFCSCLVLCSFKKVSFKRKETDWCPLWDVAPAVTSRWTKAGPLPEPCLLHWPGLWLIYNIINNYYCSCMYWPFAMLHALCQALIIHYFI